MASEGIGGRMSGMSKQLLLHGKIQTDEEYIDRINSIKPEEIEKIINEYYDFEKMNVVMVKPV